MENFNIEKFADCSLFVDKVTGSCCGFCGPVDVLNEKIFIDTTTMSGVDKLLKKLDSMISFLANKFMPKDLDINDKKQDVIVLMLESLPKYDPRKEVKLSSFLQLVVTRKLIKLIREIKSIRKNATTLKTNNYKIKCNCGHLFDDIISEDDIKTIKCVKCGSGDLKKMRINYEELLIDENSPINYINQKFDVNQTENRLLSNIDVKMSINSQPKIVKTALTMICAQNYSIYEVTKLLASPSIDFKIKSLQRKKIFKSISGR